MRVVLRAKHASPGLGVSSAPLRKASSTAAGTSMRRRCSTSSASAQVLGSGCVGPLAITAGSSPGTSEISSVCTGAGAHAAASRPPLIADRWRRTQFISAIVAPLSSSSRLMRCLSASVSPAAGSGSSAEPPPLISAMTWSSGPRPRASSSMRRAAASPAASGTGCAASTSSMRRSARSGGT
ncbi:hypothetical protein GALL_537830 [mine drainage metagenome]|uniref:Uncharacterized protein n=1 Tax=mine drainage metagenome TaxID=410659 RepID=A0A1J5NZG8_9ZZZZ